MKLIIDKNRKVYSAGTWGTVNENDYEILEFEFPEELEEYNKRIVYYLDDEKVWDTIVNNKAYITNAITTKGDVKAYVWCTKENTEREADTDFRTMLFEMHFYENENADGIVPTEEQVDGFNTMLTAMNAKIDEVDALEQTIGAAESQRQEAEATRVSNENTRESNESTRQTNEQTRQEQEADRERRTDEAIGNIEDKTAEYNQNAEAKTNEFNQNATQKTNDFNSNYTQKVNNFNTNASSKESAFNTNASSKTSNFNSNAETKTNAFNTNATEKTTAYNTNAQNKIDEYDEHIADYQAQIDKLQEEVEELSENMPWSTTEQATEISVDDAAKYSKNKLELFGNTEQTQYSGKNLLQIINPTKWGYSSGIPNQAATTAITINNYDSNSINFKINANGYLLVLLDNITLKPNTNYVISFARTNSPEHGSRNYIYSKSESTYALLKQNFSSNNVTISFTTTSTGIIAVGFAVDNTASGVTVNVSNIMIEEGSTATDYEPYTNGASPNPDYPQDIHVVTGNNTISVGNTDYPINLGSLELCKIGNYQDYLYKENGNWYIQKNTGKTILGKPTTGNLNTDYTYNYFSYRGEPSGIYPGLNIICSHFIGAYNIADMRTKAQFNNSVYWGSNSTIVRVDKFNTVEEYINALSANDITIIGRARTPTTTQITDETLISQLDAIYEHLQLVKGTNNITVTAEDLAPYMKLTYMQDLKAKLNNLDSRLSLLE